MRKSAVVRDLVLAIVLGLVPGWGHIYLRRPLRGLVIFILFFAAIDLVFLLAMNVRINVSQTLVKPLLAAAVGLWVYALVDVVRWALWSRSRSALARRQMHFRKVVAHFLKNEYGQAEEFAHRMLKIDPRDGTALVYLGLIQGARGEKRRATSTLKRALKHRRDDTSTEDIERELKRLSEDVGS